MSELEESFDEANQKRLIFEFIASDDDSRFKRLIKDMSPHTARSIVHEDSELGMLHWASLKGALIIQNWLIDKFEFPADLDDNPYVWSPAHVAVIGGQEICLEALLARKPEVVNRPDKRGCTPLHLAAAHGRSHCMDKILKCTRVMPQVNKQCSKNMWSPLMYATWHGRISCVELLIRHGAVTDIIDNEGRTPLHLAAAEGHLPLVKYLADHGCRNVIKCLNDVDNNGFTPKMAAELNKKVEVVNYLIDKEKDPRSWETHDDIAYPCHVAALNGDLENLKNLLQRGYVGINDVDNRGYSMLHKAVVNNQIAIVQWVLGAGASIYLRTLANETALDIAKRRGNSSIIEILEKEEHELALMQSKQETDKNIYVPILGPLDHYDSKNPMDAKKWLDLVEENEVEFRHLEELMAVAKEDLISAEDVFKSLDNESLANSSKVMDSTKKIEFLKHDIAKLKHQTEVVKFNLYQLKMEPTLKEMEIGRALAECENQFEETSDQLYFEKEKREQIEAELSELRLVLIRIRDYILTNDVTDELLTIVLAIDSNIIGQQNIPFLNLNDIPVNKNEKYSLHFEVDQRGKINISKVFHNPMPKELTEVKTKNLSTQQFLKYIKLMLGPRKRKSRRKRQIRMFRNKKHHQSPVGGIFVTR